MSYEINEKYLNCENRKSFENSFSNNNCFINSNPIENYIDDDISKSISIKNENDTNLKYKKNKSYKEFKMSQLYNLNHPKLIEAYNEGYYGINNIPKQFYIYPKFSNKDNYLQKYKSFQEKNIEFQNDMINKENDANLMNDKNNSNTLEINTENDNIHDKFISTYTNYPYPKLINISNNLFGASHNMKSNFSFVKNELINKNNQKLDSKLLNNNIEKNSNIMNDKEEDDDGNFYYINNNITKRNVPFQNNPDDISIDDEDLEE